LDLNGVIYKCAFEASSLNNMALETRFAAANWVDASSFDEIWFNVFNYINYIIQMVAPRKLVMITFDGVAPRAKMNNQRSRRFKSAKTYENLDAVLREMKIIPEKGNYKNNNAISPGTWFMRQLQKELEFFVIRKFAEDPNFKNVQVIFSGPDVPGEGEHKVTMDLLIANSIADGFHASTGEAQRLRSKHNSLRLWGGCRSHPIIIDHPPS
jgi:5'-3' exoribonuclease 1